MQQTALHEDLCLTCLNISICLHCFNSRHPIRTCESYKEDKNLTNNGPIDKSTMLLGLCKYCSKRQSCDIFKPEGGVWHCACYQ